MSVFTTANIAYPKPHVAQMRLAMPATSDYWVNDQAGDPLFVVTAQAKRWLGEDAPGHPGADRLLVGDRRVTVVFDRGGYSPKFFLQIVRSGFDLRHLGSERIDRHLAGAKAKASDRPRGVSPFPAFRT
jgi:hypothetical protein